MSDNEILDPVAYKLDRAAFQAGNNSLSSSLIRFQREAPPTDGHRHAGQILMGKATTNVNLFAEIETQASRLRKMGLRVMRKRRKTRNKAECTLRPSEVRLKTDERSIYANVKGDGKVVAKTQQGLTINTKAIVPTVQITTYKVYDAAGVCVLSTNIRSVARDRYDHMAAGSVAVRSKKDKQYYEALSK